MEWGRYTLVVREKATGLIVETIEYRGMSGNAMMDEQKHIHNTKYPRDLYVIEW